MTRKQHIRTLILGAMVFAFSGCLEDSDGEGGDGGTIGPPAQAEWLALEGLRGQVVWRAVAALQESVHQVNHSRPTMAAIPVNAPIAA